MGLTLAGLAVARWLAVVSCVAVVAVLAVAPRRVVPTLQTHPPTAPARLLEHLHAEPALGGVAVTLARWGRVEGGREDIFHN